MKKGTDNYALFLAHYFIYNWDGDNDGLVPVNSTKWGLYQHIIPPKESKGISHQSIVDIKKCDLKHFNLAAFYDNVIAELMNRGF